MSIKCGEYSRTILIVDNFEAERLCYQRYLKCSTKYRYQFITSEIGEEASFLYQRYSPDIVLLDYLLPAADPVAVIKELHALNAAHRAPVVVIIEDSMTAEYDARRALGAGAYDCLLKDTITAIRLKDVIERVIFAVESSDYGYQPADLVRRFAAIDPVKRHWNQHKKELFDVHANVLNSV